MFDSLALEDPRNTTRRWTTLMSFTIETALVGMLIAAPLAFNEKLQSIRVGEQLVAPTSMAVDTVNEPAQTPPANTHDVSEINADNKLIAPSTFPKSPVNIVDEAPIGPSSWNSIVGAPVGPATNSATMRNLMDTIRPHIATVVPTTTHAPLKISHLDPGFLIQKVQPVYPRNAIITKTEGSVLLAALIDTQGRVTQLHAISGHPFLIPAAIDAVRQWRYKPYILNGSPVEVETQVSVIFSLNSH